MLRHRALIHRYFGLLRPLFGCEAHLYWSGHRPRLSEGERTDAPPLAARLASCSAFRQVAPVVARSLSPGILGRHSISVVQWLQFRPGLRGAGVVAVHCTHILEPYLFVLGFDAHQRLDDSAPKMLVCAKNDSRARLVATSRGCIVAANTNSTAFIIAAICEAACSAWLADAKELTAERS